MTTQTYDQMVRDVIMHAPHCTELTAEYSVKMTVIDFCNRTRWWKYTSDPISIVADLNTYDVEVPADTEAISVDAVWYRNRPLWPLGFSTREKMQPVRLDSRSGPPSAFSSKGPPEFTLYPTPKDSESLALVVVASIRPKRSSTGADRDMMERWYDAIVHGALARVYAIPNQPFTSRDSAMDRMRMYVAEVTRARIDANKSMTSASLQVQPRQPW